MKHEGPLRLTQEIYNLTYDVYVCSLHKKANFQDPYGFSPLAIRASSGPSFRPNRQVQRPSVGFLNCTPTYTYPSPKKKGGDPTNRVSGKNKSIAEVGSRFVRDDVWSSRPFEPVCRNWKLLNLSSFRPRNRIN